MSGAVFAATGHVFSLLYSLHAWKLIFYSCSYFIAFKTDFYIFWFNIKIWQVL